MRFKPYYIIFLSVATMGSLHAAYTVKDGKIVNKNEMATLSVQEHYASVMDAYQRKDWEEVLHQTLIVTKNFPTSPFAPEALFYSAVGHFYLKDYEASNKQLTAYLKKQATPKHFEEAIQYKFAIAEKYKGGAKKHVMGLDSLPKWIPAREDAIAIYDEVITALPHHDLGAQALFGKAKLLFKDEDYKASIESYQTLIRRFPKNSLAAESYIGIAEVYLTECKAQYPDPDFLDLAEINLRKFRQDFPGEDRLGTAEKMFLDMKEIYARSLFETAQFFERTKKPHASIIYYSNIIAKYPETKIADLSKKRLDVLSKNSKTDKKGTEEAVHDEEIASREPEPSVPQAPPQDSNTKLQSPAEESALNTPAAALEEQAKVYTPSEPAAPLLQLDGAKEKLSDQVVEANPPAVNQDEVKK